METTKLYRTGLPVLTAAALCGALSTAAWAEPPTSADPSLDAGLPQIEGFKKLLPRGAIPAIVDPVFVDAEDAEMPAEAWVLGFEIGGETFAYDLNLLNRHEVVNQSVDRVDFAAVW